MRALLIAVLIAACGDRSSEDIEKDVNADRTSCNGEWGPIIFDCARVCLPKPAAISVSGCGPFPRKVEGVQGHCNNEGDSVYWFPCEGQ